MLFQDNCFLKYVFKEYKLGIQIMPNIFSLNLTSPVDKFISETALARKHLLIFKLNVYPRFAISRQLSNLLELKS